ncbi:MAG TPA: hypothetical protein ENJ62_06450 [Bryobacterales bacterium]|nr:hypothetical protein [Bryobacterales bacterium]
MSRAEQIRDNLEMIRCTARASASVTEGGDGSPYYKVEVTFSSHRSDVTATFVWPANELPERGSMIIPPQDYAVHLGLDDEMSKDTLEEVRKTDEVIHAAVEKAIARVRRP